MRAGSLDIAVTAQTSQFEEGMRRARTEIDRTERSAGSMRSQFDRLRETFGRGSIFSQGARALTLTGPLIGIRLMLAELDRMSKAVEHFNEDLAKTGSHATPLEVLRMDAIKVIPVLGEVATAMETIFKATRAGDGLRQAEKMTKINAAWAGAQNLHDHLRTADAREHLLGIDRERFDSTQQMADDFKKIAEEKQKMLDSGVRQDLVEKFGNENEAIARHMDAMRQWDISDAEHAREMERLAEIEKPASEMLLAAREREREVGKTGREISMRHARIAGMDTDQLKEFMRLWDKQKKREDDATEEQDRKDMARIEREADLRVAGKVASPLSDRHIPALAGIESRSSEAAAIVAAASTRAQTGSVGPDQIRDIIKQVLDQEKEQRKLQEKILDALKDQPVWIDAGGG